MGQSSSNRRNNYHHPNPNPNPNPIPSSQIPSSYSSNPPHPPTLSNFSPPPPPPNYIFPSNSSYPPPHQNPNPNPNPAPPPQYHRQNPNPIPPPQRFCSQYSNSYGNYYQYVGSTNPNYPHYPNQNNGWLPFRPSSSSMIPTQPPPPYVDHQKTTKVKSDINLHKETIRLELDDQNPDCHLVSFTFDSVVDGSITIYYFAKEGTNCNFSPLYPDTFMPVRVPFQKGVHQKFHQPSGTGIDLGFFELDDLSKPSTDDVFPLVISAEASSPHLATDEQLGQPPNTTHAQITQAILVKKDNEPFQVKVIKQVLWVDGVRYELREIFGIANQEKTEFDEDDQGKECVICMSEPRDTAVLPCRHMCMCSECAKVFRLQSNTCPICRQPVQQLIEIKVKNDDQ
ncbi:putative E3 ubiquitin-protein ligase LUL2 [Tasmannia lanceolata]|uniref:putative E3 ubiquitin-protein ligase LUL2 n=1 Tax=Tasmannia lanceolata TaxID=3420 RepID=UPI004063AF50